MTFVLLSIGLFIKWVKVKFFKSCISSVIRKGLDTHVDNIRKFEMLVIWDALLFLCAKLFSQNFVLETSIMTPQNFPNYSDLESFSACKDFLNLSFSHHLTFCWWTEKTLCALQTLRPKLSEIHHISYWFRPSKLWVMTARFKFLTLFSYFISVSLVFYVALLRCFAVTFLFCTLILVHFCFQKLHAVGFLFRG